MRRLAPLAVISLLAAGLIGFTGSHASADTQAAQPTPSQTCILVIICFPVPPSSGPSSPPAPSLPLPLPLPLPSPSATTPRDATAAPGLVVSSATWTMTISSARMTGFTYKGNVSLPVAGGGTVRVMEFTVDSMSMSQAVTRITEDGQTGTETDASFSASGVTMYATRLSGSILGVPVTFTPSTASAVLLSVANLATSLVPITMTGVTADQAVILAGQAQKTAVGVTG